MKGKTRPDRLRDYVVRLLSSNAYDHLIGNRFFQGTITAVTTNGVAYLCQIQRVGDTGADGNDYLCVTPGYTPVVGDVVECEWRDLNVGYVLWPVNGISRADRLWNSTTLTTTSSSVAVASNLPQTGYRHLEIVVQARGDTAATAVECAMQFNGDTGNNYGDVRLTTNGSVVAGSDQGGSLTSAVIGWYSTAASSPSGYASCTRILVPNYAGTTFYKTVLINGAYNNNASFPAATGMGTDQTGSVWVDASAITSIEIHPITGNFIAGSTFDVYLRGTQ